MYYYPFILAIGAERFVELAVAQRNAKWSFAHGGKEFRRDHYPAMVSMHALLLVSCIVAVWALGRPFIPWLGWPMLAVVVLSTVVRWRCSPCGSARRTPRWATHSNQGATGRFVHSRSARRDERNHPPAAPVPPSVGMV
jgi:methyltransferase